MFKARMTKLLSNHDNLRDGVVEGDLRSLPVVGEGVIITSPREDGLIRYVSTSPVDNIHHKEDGSYVILTKNSTYRLEIL